MQKKTGRSLIISIITIFLLLFFTTPQASALPLPVLDFIGVIMTTVNNSTNEVESTSGGVIVSSYVDLDGNFYSFDIGTDPILGEPVLGAVPTGISYDWANDILSVDPSATAVFQIGDTADPYLTATVTNIQVHRLGYRDYRIDALLTNQFLYHTSDSLFMEQYEQAVGSQNIGQLLTWDLVFHSIPRDDTTTYYVNVAGKVAPVPEPGTVLLLGIGFLSLAMGARIKSKRS